jgi:UDP-N-acetylmuramoylalanine--D-glutamate ligase
MQLAGKHVVVVGLAQTGVAVARFCATRGARVTVTDARPADALAERADALAGVAALELGGHQTETFTGADLIVMSPGVPELPFTRAARATGVEVIAEIELAYRFLDPGATLIAITGTNGKSTTTALTGALCEASGRATFCGGNLGNHPMIEACDHPANAPGGLIVVEVAGFMLETCSSFRPHIAACLNITEDHLDRYGTLGVYASMKTRIFKWQRSEDLAIANARDPLTVAGAGAASSRAVLFSSAGPPDPDFFRGAWLSDDRREIVVQLPDAERERYPVGDLTIVGTHNLENAMAAYLAARRAGVEPAAIRRGAAAYVPRRHRMELVTEAGGVAYYDDSKGTNVAAVAASITGFPRPVVLIAGGVDKGGSYVPMLAALDEVARGMVLIGEAAPLIRAAAERHGARYPIVDASSMADAVRRAAELAQPGDAVVLSPACSSYDMFQNFEDRGRVFCAAVREHTRAS